MTDVEERARIVAYLQRRADDAEDHNDVFKAEVIRTLADSVARKAHWRVGLDVPKNKFGGG